jgi:hypothetical protein
LGAVTVRHCYNILGYWSRGAGGDTLRLRRPPGIRLLLPSLRRLKLLLLLKLLEVSLGKEGVIAGHLLLKRLHCIWVVVLLLLVGMDLLHGWQRWWWRKWLLRLGESTLLDRVPFWYIIVIVVIPATRFNRRSFTILLNQLPDMLYWTSGYMLSALEGVCCYISSGV